jgi:hypothetical protein
MSLVVRYDSDEKDDQQKYSSERLPGCGSLMAPPYEVLRFSSWEAVCDDGNVEYLYSLMSRTGIQLL